MTVLRMVVVIRTIEVGRHDTYIIRPVLGVEILAVPEPAYLCQCVSLICRLQRGCKETGLGHGLGSKLGINTGRAQKLKFFAAVFPCTVDNVHLKNHVDIHEISLGLCISHNTAHLCSGKKYILRLFLFKEGLNLILSCKVQFLMSSENKVVITLSLQLSYYGRAHHSVVAGHKNLCLSIHHLTRPFSRYSARFVLICSSALSTATFFIS